MKRFIAFSIFLAGFHLAAMADHITGGEMFYTYMGKNGSENQYLVILKLFMRCNSGRRFNDPTTVAVFDRLSSVRIKDISVPLTRQENIRLNNSNPCITNPPDVCYDVAYYEFTISLPSNENGYLLASQVNYRISGINNLSNGYGQIGATYTAEIPGTSHAETTTENNSAHFTGSDLVIVCASNSFSYSFAADDADGDELRYSFCEAYVSGTTGTNVSPPVPPYESVPYGHGFDGSMPLGNNVRISPTTGVITGIAPASGVYVVTVCVQEVRNGVVIATQRKDLQINITECTIAAASLLPEYQLCKTSKKISISNLSNSPLISSYNWQLFNNSGTAISSSTASSINYDFADTGLYKVKLYINKGQQCSDSATSLIRVYPGLVTGFSFSGICTAKPTSFFDTSYTVYGAINSWSWDFGESITPGNTSPLINPVHTYLQTGVKNVSLILTTTKGCRDTVNKSVSILDKPPLSLVFKDTLICKGDALQLHALGNGNFSWTPALNTINATTANPVVSPPVTTNYVVELDDNGCRNKDSLQVRVVDFVSLVAGKDTTICEKDEIQLGAITNGLQFQWTPAILVNDATLLNAMAHPPATTTYQLTATIGHCTAADEVTVKVVPYPKVAAGNDTLICFNSTCQLRGFTNGSSVLWSPANTLSSATIFNPIATPTASTAYVLSAFDVKGCPKPARDTILVTVLPKIFPEAGNDTAVVIGQPLQLNASGGSYYEWSPAFNLSSASIADPVALFNEASEGLLYTVLVYNEAGCVDSDFVNIKVYEVAPTIFVPTAFTPNNDGKNDLLRPIAAGITKIEHFRIYNRWGQLVFSTSTNGKGWDGKIAGREQGTGTFVWEVKATDYKGIPYIQKGIVTLIR
jgi:gliding motility-associated-like protein